MIPDLTNITFPNEPKSFIEVYRKGKQPEKYNTMKDFVEAYKRHIVPHTPKKTWLLPHLQSAPDVNGLVGPMSNGEDKIRYEDYEVYKTLST